MKAIIRLITEPGVLEQAVALISQGHQVVIPTETIFGLTCDALNDKAVSELYAIKGRPLDKVSAIFVPSIEAIRSYAIIEQEYARRVIEQLLPGPLTIVVKSRRSHWPGVVGDDGKIGIRVSSEAFVGELAGQVGRPLIATSANKSGLPDCTSVAMLTEQLGDVVTLILYRDLQCPSIPSTVVDLTGEEPRLLRQGSIPWEKILQITG